MEDLIPIGQFARASRLTQKALRLYDENGPAAAGARPSGFRVPLLPDRPAARCDADRAPAERRDAARRDRARAGRPGAGTDRRLRGGACRENEWRATEVAFTVAEGDVTAFPAIIGAYDAVAAWAARNGRELVGPPLEINRCEEGGPARLEIAWPIR